MRKFNKYVLFVLVLLMATALVACGGNTDSQPAPSGDNSGGTKAPITVNIGYSGPLSGPAAFYGEKTLAGLEMAINEINDDGGFEIDGQPYNLNLVSLDDQYMPNNTGANAQRLVQEHETPIVFIPHSGGIFAAQTSNVENNMLIAAYTSEPALVEIGNPLTMQIPNPYSGYLPPFVKYGMEKHGKKAATLATATQYGKDWTELFVEEWEAQGGEIVFPGSIDFNKDTDFFTIVTNALKEKPDVLFIGGASPQAAMVAKQARELGFKGGFIIIDQAKMDEMVDVLGSWDALEGSVGVVPLQFSDFPGTARFLDLFGSLYGEVPGSEAGYHYVSTFILVEAMKAAGTVSDAKAIRDALPQAIKNLPDQYKVYDILEIRDDGGFRIEYRLGVVENGEFKALGEFH
ncbi:MAG: ABC transporter substrate-binding protein [Bacillota bacterium]|nr:ABC transporter substrate-binding protein [Bacillota bacterium]